MVINPPPEDDAETDVNPMSKLVGVHMNVDVKVYISVNHFLCFKLSG